VLGVTITHTPVVPRPIRLPAGPTIGPCAPGDVALFAAPVQVGTPVPGFNSEVHGIAVDERYVYATSGTTGIQNGHDTAGPGELVVFDRGQLRSAVHAGTVPPVRRVTVGKQPRSVASLVRPDYQRVFVVNYHQDSYSVTVLDRRTFGQVAEAKIGMTPIDVAVHAGRGRAYVTDGYHAVRSLDARTGVEVADERIEIGREIVGIAVDEASDTMFVVHSKQYEQPPIDQLVVVDLTTRAITHRVHFPEHSSPRDVAYDAATGKIYVGFVGKIDEAGRIGVLQLDRAALDAPPIALVTTGVVLMVAVGTSGGATRVYATAQGRLDVLDPVSGLRQGSTPPIAQRLCPVAVDPATGEVYTGDLFHGRLFRVAPVPAGPIASHPLVDDGTLGAALDAPRPAPDGEALVQQFQHGLAVASAEFGAVVVRGSHQATWATSAPGAVSGRAVRGAAAALGNPAADTMTVAGRSVTYFAGGAIVTLDSGTDVVVSGPIWERYAQGGEVGGGFGLPLGPEVPSPAGGGHQEFEHAVMFHRGTGGAAMVVQRGPVWDAWVGQHGGVGGHLGFPVGDLVRRYHLDLGIPDAEWVQFENGALVWNGNEDAVHRLYVAFWREWQTEGGADGHLGLPTSSPLASPHDPASPLWYVNFSGGVMVLFPEGHPLRPPQRECHVVRSLELRITGFRAIHSDTITGGLPDPYIDHWLSARHGDADPYFRWDGRLAGPDGYWEDVVEVPWEPTSIPLADRVRGDLVVNLAFHCWDFDSSSEDDKLGEIERSYTVDNLWGLSGEAEEHHASTDEGEFFAYYVMKPEDEPVDLSGNFRGRYFWQFRNFDTARLPSEIYSRVYTDVEAGIQFSLDPRDWLREGWEALFYHLFFKKIAKPGNCYGMSVEAVEALHRRSSFASPVYRHGHPRLGLDPGDELYGTPDPSIPDDVDLMTRMNVRHAGQLGSRVVEHVARYIMDTLRGGAIDDGQRIWRESKSAYERGDWPVFAMAKEWKKGSHTVLPYRWTEFPDGTKEIWIADPSKPPLLRDPDDLSDGLERVFVFADGAWSYQRFVDGAFSQVGSYSSATPRWLISIPMSCFTGQHTLPTVGAVLDIVLHGIADWAAGIVVGGDVDTKQITDAAGRTLFRPDLDHLPSSPLDLRSDADGFVPGVVPMLAFGGEDVPVEGELYHAVGRHDLLAHDLVPRSPGGTYHWAMRQGPVAVSIAAPTDAHPDRIHAEQLGSAARAVGFARGKTLPPKPIAMMVEAFPRSAVPASRVPADQRTRQYLLEDLTVVGGQQVVARPSDGGNELLVSSYGAPATFAVRMRGRSGTSLSRVRRISVDKDRTAVLRPQGWSAESLDSAPLAVEVRESPDGPRVRCYEALPEGPAEA
jgi:DNA-binding beta-propeller fold protein YncE